MLKSFNISCRISKEVKSTDLKPSSKEKFKFKIEGTDEVIEVKDESDMDSFLSGDIVDFKHGQIKGLDDFELICFLVIKEVKNV